MPCGAGGGAWWPWRRGPAPAMDRIDRRMWALCAALFWPKVQMLLVGDFCCKQPHYFAEGWSTLKSSRHFAPTASTARLPSSLAVVRGFVTRLPASSCATAAKELSSAAAERPSWHVRQRLSAPIREGRACTKLATSGTPVLAQLLSGSRWTSLVG